MNITFLTSGHIPKDDRIFYHQAQTLATAGFKVDIISSRTELTGIEDGVIFNSFKGDKLTKKEKINRFKKLLAGSKPDIIICQEPITILAAGIYRKQTDKKPKIIYDITEWYPAKKVLVNYNFILRLFHFPKFLIFNFLMAAQADAFIFGEWYKGKPYRFLFHRKDFIYSYYYPDLKYIKYKEPGQKKGYLRLSYSGKLSFEKGFGNFLETIKEISVKKPSLKINIKIIGWYSDMKEQIKFKKMIDTLSSNVSFQFYPLQDFQKFIEIISDTDIFLDLRSDDFENRHCLPIKLFYYAALKRPVIYTELKAIRKEVEIEKFGYLTKPYNTQHIAGLIVNYIDNQKLYNQHSKNARDLAESRYNWDAIKYEFIEFLKHLTEK